MREYQVVYSVVKKSCQKISSYMCVGVFIADNEKSLRKIVEMRYPECSIKKVTPFSFYDDVT